MECSSFINPHRTARLVWIQFAVLPSTRVPPHLAQINGRRLSHISLPGCRRRTACRIQMTVSPRPKSSVRPHADRKPRRMRRLSFYSIDLLHVLRRRQDRVIMVYRVQTCTRRKLRVTRSLVDDQSLQAISIHRDRPPTALTWSISTLFFFVIMSSVLLTRWGYVGDLKLLSELLHDADMKLFRCMLHSTHPLYSPVTSALKYVLLLPLLPLHCVRKKRCHFIFACNAKC